LAIQGFLTLHFALSEADAEKLDHIIGAIVVAEAILQQHLNVRYSPIELLLHHIQALDQHLGLSKCNGLMQYDLGRIFFTYCQEIATI
jgi:hypothetical protein